VIRTGDLSTEVAGAEWKERFRRTALQFVTERFPNNADRVAAGTTFCRVMTVPVVFCGFVSLRFRSAGANCGLPLRGGRRSLSKHRFTRRHVTNRFGVLIAMTALPRL